MCYVCKEREAKSLTMPRKLSGARSRIHVCGGTQILEGEGRRSESLEGSLG